MYRIVDRRKFRRAVKGVFITVLMIAAVIWFCVFIYQHSGLNYNAEEKNTVREFVAYETLYETSSENIRLKEAIPVKVVYRITN